MSAKDYLWEKKGDGDARTRELETVLGGQKFAGMTFPAEKRTTSRRPLLLGLVAAVAALAVVGILRRSPPPVPGEAVIVREGGVERSAVVGEWIETRPQSPATLRLAKQIGTVDVRGGSRVRVQRVAENEQRLELERGHLHAVVTAPPRLFVVDTPSATAVDLGCEYTLEIGPDGSSRLDVISGEVMLEGAGQQTRVLDGMWAVSKKNEAPTVAFDTLSTRAFIAAVRQLDASDESTLDVLLTRAERRDAVTLFQLRARVTDSRRAKVEARLAELVPRPATGGDDAWFAQCDDARVR